MTKLAEFKEYIKIHHPDFAMTLDNGMLITDYYAGFNFCLDTTCTDCVLFDCCRYNAKPPAISKVRKQHPEYFL
jgi:hypothetical protein